LTTADVKLEIEAELEAAALRRHASAQTAPVTDTEVTDYYNANRKLFRVPEVRITDLVENMPSRAVASTLVRRVGTRARFTSKADHEVLQRGYSALHHSSAEVVSLEHAIFAARAGVPSVPMRLAGHWTVFIVRAIRHQHFEPLASVRGKIVERLARRHREEAESAFLREYRRRWIARTSCRASYVVAGCAQYGGALAPDEPL
jgi:hypothetical protein